MVSVNAFLKGLVSFANVNRSDRAAGDGRVFESRVERHLGAIAARPVELFSGVSLLGSPALSRGRESRDVDAAIALDLAPHECCSGSRGPRICPAGWLREWIKPTIPIGDAA